MKPEIEDTFKENGYKLVLNDHSISITRKSSLLGVVLYSLVMLITIPFLFIGGYKVLIFFILLLGIPLIYRKWMLPKKIIISKVNNTLSAVKNPLQTQAIPFKEISNFKVDEKVINSDVSPFKEGYQDFVYVFSVDTNPKKGLELFSLQFRQPMDELIADIFTYFNHQLKIAKNQEASL